MGKKLNKGLSAVMTVILLCTSVSVTQFQKQYRVKAAESAGSLATDVTGTWSYWDGSKTVTQTNKMLFDKLPTVANRGTTRFTTENYDRSTGAFDMGEWGTSFMWSYTADRWGNSTYAIPLSYKAVPEGLYVTKPSTIRIETAFLMDQPENGSLTDFCVGPAFVSGSKKVDRVTDWGYDLVFENASNPSNYMKTTLVQGSPFSFYELTGSTQMQITRLRPNLPSYISYYNGNSISDSTTIVFRVFDNQDDSVGYSNYDYYAVFVPEGTTWTQSGNNTGNAIGTMTATFPTAEKSYLTFAWLGEEKAENTPTAKIPSADAKAEAVAKEYEKYAYNFITDTNAQYTYDASTSTVQTTYSYRFDKKAESSADGTVMGILPHQYKHMSGYDYLDNTARTIRGTMKFLAGSSYETKLKYTGILPSMLPIDEADYPALQDYIDDFMETFGPTEQTVTKESYDVNTYDTGKKLNRAVQVMEAAESCGDRESAQKLLKGIEAELADWFTADGEEDDKYFYYDPNIGSLFGFPQAYYTVDGMTDHHFHYGYFINAAAQVALRDPDFAAKYDGIVRELIGDIATTKENTPDSRYPQLRYFSQYEGHSWASGHANFADGNNQESSSEALNAWAGLILYGQAMNDDALTQTGIYLYTTEVSSVNNYWFDIDGDVLDESFKKGDLHSLASMVWGGKYGYEAWWTAEPLQVQGINILPMTAASFYAAENKDFILKNFNTALANEAAFNGTDKDVNRWNEIWSIYLAMADPDRALTYFNPDCEPEAGESKAHAYHMIMAFQKYGTPDLSVSGNLPLCAVFTDADGNKTYTAFNTQNQAKEVTFSDGTKIEAKAGELTAVSEEQTTGKVLYSIEHYLQQFDGSYLLTHREEKSAAIGSNVTAVAKDYAGYHLDTQVEGTLVSGTVTEETPLVLKLYYVQDEIKEPSAGADDSLYQKLGTYNGLDLSYYLIRDDFGITPKLLDANETFYIEYTGTYNASNTKGYMNQRETPENVLTGVYKFQTKTLQPDSYTTVKLKSGDKLVTMIIKYGNPTEGPFIDDEDFEIPTPDAGKPTEAAAVILGNPSDNTLTVTIRETQEQQEKGQRYQIYLNGQLYQSGLTAGTYQFEQLSAGRYTVKVSAVLGNTESEGITQSIRISGADLTPPENTTKPQQATDSTTPAESSTKTPESTDFEMETKTPESTDDETGSTTQAEGTTTQNMGTTQTPVSTQNTSVTKPDTVKQTKSDKTIQGSGTKAKTQGLKKPVIKKAVKKKTAKKIRIRVRKVKAAQGYQVRVYVSAKQAKKNRRWIVSRRTKKNRKVFTISSAKLRKKKILYIRVCAYRNSGGKKSYGKWSKKKKVKIR